MAMIQCAECGGKVSSKAAACPHCGAPVPPMPPDEGPPPPELEPPPNQALAKEYFLLIENTEAGPFSLEELNTKWRAKEISSVTRYAELGMNSWEPLANIIQQVAEYRPEPVSPPPGNPLPHAANSQQPTSSTPLAAAPSQTPSPPQKQHGPLTTGCAVIAGGIGLLLLIGAIGSALQSPQQRQQGEQRNMDFDAHYTAEQFIRKQYPGARSVSAFRESVVQREGNIYRVEVNVDGMNAFGGPVRNAMVVEMELNGGTWKLIQIHQK